LNDLKRGRVHILVTTDVSSRGISMEATAHVVNFDVPHRPEDYLHRIGHTAQGGAPSDAFTLMSPEEQAAVTLIERFLGRTVPRVLLPDFDYRMRPTEIKQAVSYPSRDRHPTTVVPVKVPIKPAPKPNSKGPAKPITRPAAAPSATRSHVRPTKPAARSSRTTHPSRSKKRPARGKR
jgi:superfamily II DNA/RNA helicase